MKAQSTIHDRAPEFALETVLPAERARLVRLCARLSGDRSVAEDLAQETLIEAWRHAGKLRDAAGYAPWLSSIARNVCLRWRRSQGREAARLARLGALASDPPVIGGPGAIAGTDPGAALERDELAELLDRALALLPEETRVAVVEHYIAERPQAQIAARLGLSEGAVAVRLHRGRQALRRALRGELGAGTAPCAAAGGMDPAAPADGGAGRWAETRIWCPQCGQRRILGRFSLTPGRFELRCPDCYPRYGVHVSETAGSDWFHTLFGGVKGFKPALSRMARDTDRHLRSALPVGVATCLDCGRPLPIHMGLEPDDPPGLRAVRGVHTYCTDCLRSDSTRLNNLVLYLAEGQRFWRAHPRLRLLPEREVERDGRAALVIGYESRAAAAGYAVVVARDTYEILHIDGGDDRER